MKEEEKYSISSNITVIPRVNKVQCNNSNNK